MKNFWFNFETRSFIPENFKPLQLATYKNHLKKLAIIISLLASLVSAANVFQVEKKLLSFLHFCHHVDGKRASKLAGIASLSTSAMYNKFCICRAIHGKINSICRKCYAIAQQKMQLGVLLCGIRNREILLNHVYSMESMKTVYIGEEHYCRIESFGDVETPEQAMNYLTLIYCNPDKQFGIWSKNVGIWAQAFEKMGKPENCTFVVSSEIINCPAPIRENWKWFVDHRFTVYEKKYAVKNGIQINCGGRKCLTCLTCYHKNNVFDIAELLK